MFSTVEVGSFQDEEGGAMCKTCLGSFWMETLQGRAERTWKTRKDWPSFLHVYSVYPCFCLVLSDQVYAFFFPRFRLKVSEEQSHTAERPENLWHQHFWFPGFVKLPGWRLDNSFREGWGICCGNSWSTELWDSGVFDVKTPVTWFGEKWGNLEGTGMDAMMQLMEEILCHFGILKAL